MKTGLTISAALHAAVLLWAVVSFGPRLMEVTPTESMPIDLVPTSEFTKLTAGSQKGKVEPPKPLAEKVAEQKRVDDPTPKVVPKQEIAPTMPPVPPPAPQPKVAEAKPESKPAEAKPEPKPKEAEKKETAPKPDPIAEVLKKEEAPKPEPKKEEAKASKPEPKREEAKAPTPPKPAEPQKPQPKFDATRISALLDKRAPQRQAATDVALNYTATAGTKNGTAAQLSASEIDAFKRKLQGCWNPPAGVSNAEKMLVPITVRLKLDGTLATPPQPDIDARDPAMRAMIDSTVRALIMCQPYTMFSAAKYDTWKELPLDFSPRDLFGG